MSHLLFVALLASSIAQDEPIVFEHSANANPVVSTVEGRCGPNVYKIVLLESAGANKQRLSFSVNNVEIAPIELSKFSRITKYTYIDDVTFKECIRQKGVLNGVRMHAYISGTKDHTLVVIDLIDGKIFPEVPGRSLLN